MWELHEEHWEQADHRCVSDNGRYHREAESVGLRELFLQRMEAQAYFKDLLCSWIALRGRLSEQSEHALWHVLLANEYEQREGK